MENYEVFLNEDNDDAKINKNNMFFTHMITQGHLWVSMGKPYVNIAKAHSAI